jgi:DNA-directed RNA polymerase specialized sigma24 family protein
VSHPPVASHSPINASRAVLVRKLGDPAFAAALAQFVRSRVPEHEVRDIVQATIADALDAERHPEGDEDIARWVHGICRHKVVDWFRRAKREVPRDLEWPEDGPAPAAAVAGVESAPQGALDLLRWAQKELPAGAENEKTLEWMLREGEGEKLEAIAAEANLPAARVRQRVSRLRRYYKARWAAQAAAVAALVLIALAIAFALRRRQEEVAPAPGPSLVPTSVPSMAPPGPAPLPLERPAQSTAPPEPAPSASAPWYGEQSSKEGPLKTVPTPVPSANWGSFSTGGPDPTAAPKKGMRGKPAPKGIAFDPLSEPQRSSSEVPPPPAPSDPLDSWGTKAPRKSK